MTTTESQITSGKAESTIDTPEFRGLMLAASTAWPTQVKQIKALVEYIDGKLANAWQQGRQFQHELADKPLRERAEKAEAELKTIAERQAAGLAKLQRYDFQGNAEYEAFRIASPEGEYIEFDDVAAILSPAQQEPAKFPSLKFTHDVVGNKVVRSTTNALFGINTENDPDQIREVIVTKNTTDGGNKTPLYVEDLIKILENSHTYAVAGYMGAAERVISHEGLLNALRAMKNESD